MLDSGSGEDIVLAGSTIYDNNAVALQAIESDWSTNDGTFLQRVAALPSPSGIKGGYELYIPTVTNTCGAIAMTSPAGEHLRQRSTRVSCAHRALSPPRPQGSRCRGHGLWLAFEHFAEQVRLEPTPCCEDRILSPVRLPEPWHWKQVAAVLKVCESKARTTPPWCFRIVAAWGLTLPILFPICSQLAPELRPVQAGRRDLFRCGGGATIRCRRNDERDERLAIMHGIRIEQVGDLDHDLPPSKHVLWSMMIWGTDTQCTSGMEGRCRRRSSRSDSRADEQLDRPG